MQQKLRKARFSSSVLQILFSFFKEVSGSYSLYNIWPLCCLATFWNNLGVCREGAVQSVQVLQNLILLNYFLKALSVLFCLFLTYGNKTVTFPFIFIKSTWHFTGTWYLKCPLTTSFTWTNSASLCNFHTVCTEQNPCPSMPYSCCSFGADIWELFVWLKCTPSNKDLRIKSPLLPNTGRTSSKPSSETARRDQQSSADSSIPVCATEAHMLKVAIAGDKSPSQQQCLLSVAFLGPTAAAWAVSPPQRAPFSALDHQLAQAWEGLCWRRCKAGITGVARAWVCTELQELGRALGQHKAHGGHPWQVFI